MLTTYMLYAFGAAVIPGTFRDHFVVGFVIALAVGYVVTVRRALSEDDA